jgi:REP element-mobilizing transposase RayT
MSRLPRVLYADRVAHCYIHALEGIRFDKEDVAVFLEKLRILKHKHGFHILYYSILSTHVHWIMSFSEDISCGKVMGIIHTALAKAFNGKHHRKGHVLRERYKDVTVQEENHFWSAMTYVALNKMKAGMVNSPEDDLSSSYRVYAYGEEDFITVLAEEYLDLGRNKAECQEEFRMMVREAWKRFLDAQSWEHFEDDQEFIVANGRVDIKKFMAMSDFEDKVLAKIEKDEKAAQEDDLLFTGKALEALNKLREKRQALHKELVLHLRKLGIPGRVAKAFWAGEGFIVDFVESHRGSFGLTPIVPSG